MVVVRSSKNLPLGKTMNDLRTWLDSERIEPVDFKTAGGRFEISFRREREAERFSDGVLHCCHEAHGVKRRVRG
jgi:hypothetical protein